MRQHHTAFFETLKIGAEESGVESFGLGPFYSFIHRYYHHFHSRSRPIFQERARQYISGLFQLSKKRNLERIDRKVTDSEYQSLQHFLTHSPWDDKAVCAQISKDVNHLLGGSPDSCLIIDPSATPKKGLHSVGVARQYCGKRGKIDNCQVGVFAAMAKGRDAALVNARLYLPKDWIDNPARCAKAGVPEEHQVYKCRAQLALELIEDADRAGLDYQWIGLDSEFGRLPWFLHLFDDMGKSFLLDVPSNFYVHKRHPSMTTSPYKARMTRLRLRRKPVKVDAFVRAHGRRKWRRISIRDSSRGELIADFLHKRVWVANKETGAYRPWNLIIRRTPKETGVGWEYKYSLSNAPLETKTKVLAYRQSQRYWVERAIQDTKDGLGLDEYQVRKWRSWHHHVALTMLASLYVLETRLTHRESLPLLSITDVRDLLEFLLPRKVTTIEELWEQIKARHQQRWASYEWSKRRNRGDTTKSRHPPPKRKVTK